MISSARSATRFRASSSVRWQIFDGLPFEKDQVLHSTEAEFLHGLDEPPPRD